MERKRRRGRDGEWKKGSEKEKRKGARESGKMEEIEGRVVEKYIYSSPTNSSGCSYPIERRKKEVVVTPSKDDVSDDAARLRKDGQEEKCVQVETFDEDPRVIGSRSIVKSSHQQTTFPVLHRNNINK